MEEKRKVVRNHKDAAESAVTECIRKGILADFLTAQRSEVENVLRRWLKLAAKAESIEGFAESIAKDTII